MLMSFVGVGCSSCGSVVLSSTLGFATTTKLLSILPLRGGNLPNCYNDTNISIYTISQKDNRSNNLQNKKINRCNLNPDDGRKVVLFYQPFINRKHRDILWLKLTSKMNICKSISPRKFKNELL